MIKIAPLIDAAIGVIINRVSELVWSSVSKVELCHFLQVIGAAGSGSTDRTQYTVNAAHSKTGQFASGSKHFLCLTIKSNEQIVHLQVSLIPQILTPIPYKLSM